MILFLLAVCNLVVMSQKGIYANYKTILSIWDSPLRPPGKPTDDHNVPGSIAALGHLWHVVPLLVSPLVCFYTVKDGQTSGCDRNSLLLGFYDWYGHFSNSLKNKRLFHEYCAYIFYALFNTSRKKVLLTTSNPSKGPCL